MALDPHPPTEPPRAPLSVGDVPRPPLAWRVNLALFSTTVLSVLFTAARLPLHREDGPYAWLRALESGWMYAVPLFAILLTHEFGHYFAARYHRVDASLPYFIPLPVLSPFGTMGAVIVMRGRIKSRNALLDIGASGPLAGLVVAIPMLLYGLSLSTVKPIEPGWFQEGQSLLYIALKGVVLGPIPDGYDVFLHPVAFAGWTGLFVTSLNLLPVGQLDGGHIAYALFGKRQHRYARIAHHGMLLMFVINLARNAGPVVLRGAWDDLGPAIGNSVQWLVWYVILFLLFRLGGRDHPPTDPGELSPLRRFLAILSLVVFVLLFMPTPMST